MCGIAVALDWDDADATVRRLIGGILHRGDVTDPVVAISARTAFCTRRLRIVDADHAVQPQLSADGRILVSFNGEIYNHAALRHELRALGVAFKTLSDTEVLANALSVWGGGALGRLRGMFAFVALDLKSGEFIAARDAFGEKPLYLIQAGDSYLFCSEIRPLLEASPIGDVLLLPPGYALTKERCAPFVSLPPAPQRPLEQSDSRVLWTCCSPTPCKAASRRSCPSPPTSAAASTAPSSPTTPARSDATRRAISSVLKAAPDYPYAARYADMTGFDLRLVPFDGESPATFDLLDDVIETVETFEPSVIRPSLCYQVLSKSGARRRLSGGPWLVKGRTNSSAATRPWRRHSPRARRSAGPSGTNACRR